MILHLYATSGSINNYFNHKIQLKIPSDKSISKKKFFLDLFLNNSGVFLSYESAFSSYAISCLGKV